jgi:hypothetical protein
MRPTAVKCGECLDVHVFSDRTTARNSTGPYDGGLVSQMPCRAWGGEGAGVRPLDDVSGQGASLHGSARRGVCLCLRRLHGLPHWCRWGGACWGEGGASTTRHGRRALDRTRGASQALLLSLSFSLHCTYKTRSRHRRIVHRSVAPRCQVGRWKPLTLSFGTAVSTAVAAAAPCNGRPACPTPNHVAQHRNRPLHPPPLVLHQQDRPNRVQGCPLLALVPACARDRARDRARRPPSDRQPIRGPPESACDATFTQPGQ